MKLITVGTILTLLLLQNLLLSSSESDVPIFVDPIILQGTREKCPADIVKSAITDLRSEIDNFIKSYERVCECGYAGAGWKRVVFLNMTDTDQNCPGEWRLVSIPKRTCQRHSVNGCSLAAFSANGVSYSEVCGRIIGYQYGKTDGLNDPLAGIIPDQASSSVSLYDGGLFISHGTTPGRQHIWSFVSGSSQQTSNSLGCPCNINNPIIHRIPSWLGQDFFCDSATVTSSVDYVFYQDNPLWDGVGCNERVTTCCQFNNPPWFCKQLPQPTSDNIELRLCADHPSEGTPIELIEIYVR